MALALAGSLQLYEIQLWDGSVQKAWMGTQTSLTAVVQGGDSDAIDLSGRNGGGKSGQILHII